MPTIQPDVDENGNPETPKGMATEKRKQKRLTVAALAVGGIGVAVTIYLRKRSAAASASAGSGYSYPSFQPGSSGTGTPSTSDPTGALTSLMDAFTQGNQAIQSELQQVLANQTTVTSTSGAPAPPALPPMFLAGSGYAPTSDWSPGGLGTTPEVVGGDTYTPISGAPLTAYANSGGAYYFQPTPGVFQQVTPQTNLISGTPVFVKQ